MKRWFLGAIILVLVSRSRADEGMWLINQPPHEFLKKKYNVELNKNWFENVQKASIRFNNGGSGSFVSPDGLVVTNHHIGADSLLKLSGAGKDYHRDGFYARTRSEELKCPDLELNVLQEIKDVTARVQSAVKPEMTPAEAAAARRAVMATIEKEAAAANDGLRNDIVTLYHGGLYHLYRYKKYTDVRLVMAPEHAIAFFGGDTDNFEFPRYNLDVCFFRVYENGKPAKVEHYFKWSQVGPKEGSLVFVSGHPGSTNRLETLARLKHRRDVFLPYMLQLLRQREALLIQYSERGPEEARMAKSDLYRVANARKAYTGMYQGLLDPAILAKKTDIEQALRKPIEVDPEKTKIYGTPWKRIAEVQAQLADFERLYYLLERGDAFDSRLFKFARHFVRMEDELAKPVTERLKEYRGSALESLKFQLSSKAPIHTELERVKLAASLAFLSENLGGEHPLVKKVLAGKSPADRADELIDGSRLDKVDHRLRLLKDGLKNSALKDEMVDCARLVDEEARKLRQRFEELSEIESQANAKIAKALFDKYGTSVPPDATFTLRLAFGEVKGYKVGPQAIPFDTLIAGIYYRAKKQDYREPFTLPKRWLDAKDKLDLTTPFNFVSTADTIGGNSGSPVLNRAGELVGINFDRNRHGLVRNFVYTDHQARHISVHCLAVLEALRKLYDAGPLVEELLEGR